MARFRVPGRVEPGVAIADGTPMPLDSSILWRPVDAERGDDAGAFPPFVTQRALVALNEHCTSSPESCFGLLIGKLLHFPDTATPYLIIESTIRLPAGGSTEVKGALLEGWVVAQDLVRKTGNQLVGWYRGESVPSAAVGLTPADAAAHAAMFDQPWQVAIAVRAGDATAVTGGVFRRSGHDGWARECIPFYELVDPAAIQPNGGKQTRLHWTNYVSAAAELAPEAPLPVPVAPSAQLPAVAEVPPPLASPAPALRAPARVAPQVFLPEQFGIADAEGRGRLPSRLELRGVARASAYGAVGVLAVVGLFRLFGALVSPAVPAPGPAVAETPRETPQQRLDRAADTLSLAIAAFDLRAQLYASRQMQCPELARGLVLVEERWTSYNGERKASGVALDSARGARDRALYADADGVERRFERTGCPRP